MISFWDMPDGEMFMFKRKGEPPEPPPVYWEVEVTAKQRLALIDLCHQRHVPESMRKSVLGAVLDARKINMALNREHLDWAGAEAEARRQGVSVADVLFDKMGRFE